MELVQTPDGYERKVISSIDFLNFEKRRERGKQKLENRIIME